VTLAARYLNPLVTVIPIHGSWVLPMAWTPWNKVLCLRDINSLCTTPRRRLGEERYGSTHS